jgi:hypothetical protein
VAGLRKTIDDMSAGKPRSYNQCDLHDGVHSRTGRRVAAANSAEAIGQEHFPLHLLAQSVMAVRGGFYRTITSNRALATP